MKILSSDVKLEATSEEITVITKIIGQTSFDSRKNDFGLTDKESNIAHHIYEVLSNDAGDNND